MPQSPEDRYRSIVANADTSGRLATPERLTGGAFPWEVCDGELVPKIVPEPTLEEPGLGETRDGPCDVCARAADDTVVWEDENWVLEHPGQPSGLPVVLQLTARAHLDLGELDDDQASELGRLSNRLVRIIENLPHIARVQVDRGRDDGSHLRLRFSARPAGFTSIRGRWAVEWDAVLPPVDEQAWRVDLTHVSEHLANWGGTDRMTND